MVMNRSLAVATLMLAAGCSPPTTEDAEEKPAPAVSRPAPDPSPATEVRESFAEASARLLASPCEREYRQRNGVVLTEASPAALKAIGRRTGPNPQAGDRTCVWKVGIVRPGGRRFGVYYLEYVFSEAARTNHSIAILADDRTYLGRYVVEAGDIRLDGSRILIEDEGRRDVITIGPDGPPSRVRIATIERELMKPADDPAYQTP